jgi:hypothetical protein
MDDLNRRRLLQRGGLSVATAISVLSAGCLDGLPGFQGETSTPTTQDQSTDTWTTPPGTQSQSPGTRTPLSTTQRQPPTTEAPPTTTQRQQTATEAPPTTTQSRPPTSEAPPTTTQRQQTATEVSLTTTQRQSSAGEQPAYTTWLYAPRLLSWGDYYLFNTVKPQALQRYRSQISGYLGTLHNSGIQKAKQFGYSFESVERQINFTSANSYITLGSFVPSEMTVLRKPGITKEGTYRGFTLFSRNSRDTRPGTIAINNNAIISDYKRNSISTKRAVKTIIDTKAGVAGRYVDQNKVFSTLTRKLGDGDIVWVGTSPIDGFGFSDISAFRGVPIDVGGVSIKLGSSTSLLTIAFGFNTDHTVNSYDKEVVTEYIRSNYRNSVSNSISYSQEKHVLVAKANFPTNRLSAVVSA